MWFQCEKHFQCDFQCRSFIVIYKCLVVDSELIWFEGCRDIQIGDIRFFRVLKLSNRVHFVLIVVSVGLRDTHLM